MNTKATINEENIFIVLKTCHQLFLRLSVAMEANMITLQL